MACPTCSSTMHLIAKDQRDTNHFWCPRCGTIHSDRMDQGGDKTYAPKLVERCREFERRVGIRPVVEGLWHSLGIRESIHTPEHRPENKE